MLALRIVGGLLAVTLFLGTIVRYNRRQTSRLNLIITGLLAVGAAMLAISPDLFDPLFGVFNFRRGSGQRLTAVLLGAVVILFILLVRLQSYTDVNERSIRLLVEAFGRERFDWEEAGGLPVGRRVVAITPAYNEAENVAGVVHEMPEKIGEHHVVHIVIDDGSEDATSDVAREAGALVARLPIRRGGGLALRVGYEIALQLGAEVVVSLDADGQHLPEEMATIVQPILEGRADMVNGSRLLGVFERESAIRHLGVHFFSWLVTILTGQRVTDISSGYRATRAETLRRLVLEQDQFWTSEVLIEALRQRARIVEVPITIRARRGGKSKKPKSLKYGWHFSKAIIQTWLR